MFRGDRNRFKVRFASIPLAFLTIGASAIVYASLPSHQDGITPEPVDEVMHYSSSDDLRDPITLLQKKIASGKVHLIYNEKNGYLDSVLKELHLPLTSQLLVFSKTSCQAPYTSPATPRALYFDGKSYVGYAQGDVLDLIGIDPIKGPIFFTLDQKSGQPIVFKRQIRDCFQCHVGPETVNVPGLLIRSVRTNDQGKLISQVQDFVSGHNNPLAERWGGWYVTGTHGNDVHLGNGFYGQTPPTPESLKANSNIVDLKTKFDTSKYPADASDAVALLVLDHTVRMQNYIVEAQYETTTAQSERKHSTIKLVDNSNWRIKNSSESLLTYMLFRDEGALHGPIAGTTDFAKEFSKNAPRDKKGRSLYDFDLNTRVFKYPCSYMIYSDSFNALPKEMKDYLWQRLSQILTGEDRTRLYGTLSDEDRKAVLEILLDTKPEFAEWWKTHEKA